MNYLLLIPLALAIGLPHQVAGRVRDASGKHLASLSRSRQSIEAKMILANVDSYSKPRHDLSVPAMIAREGYPVETHTVVTEDCYILEMHRIPYGKKSPPQEGVKRPAVYLQHGLLSSSADFVMGIPEKFLGYILADHGYDVWLGNYRGNTYSRAHCSLDPNKNEFWHFSWDQNGKVDIPAMIDKILEVTNHTKIHYGGHSMGTTGFMVMANTRPEYLDKIIMANLLAPVAYMDHMQSPLKYLAPFLDEIEWVAEHLGLGEFLPSNWLIDFLADIVCGTNFIDAICSNIMFLLCGYDPAQLNDTLLDTIVHHTPAGASTFQIVQYGQEFKSKYFHAYDFGEEGNMAHYGTPGPRPYLLSNVKVPVSLYWSQNDWLADPLDIVRALEELPNIFDNYEVPYEKWNHLDYLWGIDANIYVYQQMLINMALAEATLV